MNCDGIRGLLSAYLDGELSPGDLLRVEQHLRRCHWCADEVEALRQTVALVASLDEVEVPMAFHAGLHDRLVALGPPAVGVRRISAQRPRYSSRRWVAPAAAAAAALAIGLTAYGRLGPVALPGLEAPKGMANFVADATPANPQTAQNPVIGTDPTTPSKTSVTPANPSGSKSNVTPSDSNPVAPPIGEVTPVPGQAITVTANPTDTTKLVKTGQVTRSAAVIIPDDQVTALTSQFPTQVQNGQYMVKVRADKFDENLKAILKIPGAQQNGDVKQFDLGQAIAENEARLQESNANLKKYRATYDTKTPAEQAAEQPMLESYQQAVAEAEATQAKLQDQLATGIVYVSVQSSAQ